MDFDQLRERAWEQSENTLSKWKERLEVCVQERAQGVNKSLRDLEVLYGKGLPDRDIVVSLHYTPEKDREKGEPAKQLAETRGIDSDLDDILYWVSEATILPSDTKEDFEKRTIDTVSRIIHEAEHALLQDKEFESLTARAEIDPRVAPIKEKLSSLQEHFIETTNELITTYLDAYTARVLWQKGGEETSTPPERSLTFKVNRKDCDQVLEWLIKADVEDWNQNGPYSRLRRAWEESLGGLPEGYESKKDKATSEKTPSKEVEGLSVYKIARSLDTSLAKRYVKEGKKIDVDFIAKLYKMVDEKVPASSKTTPGRI